MKNAIRFFAGIVTGFCLLVSVTVNAQKEPMKFGKIDPEDFTMASYPGDTAAEAVILGDYGMAELVYDQFDGFVIKYTRHFRAKIFKKSGYSWATHSLVLYNYGNIEQEVMTLKGRVYNMENGKVVESNLEKSMINDQRVDKKRTERKFTLPNVREGSIIEYELSIKSNLMEFPDWNFQYAIPARWSEYRVAYPEWFDFKKLQKGFLTFNTNESTIKPKSITFTEIERSGTTVTRSTASTSKIDYQESNFRFVVQDAPAFKEEPFMNSSSNYVSTIQFELAAFKPPYGMVKDYTKSWESINKELLDDEDFGLQLKRGGVLKDIALALKAANETPEKQVAAAFVHIRNAMKWNGLYRIYMTESIRKAWDDKSGSSADINLTLVALLKEMGIDAEPVIISTRSNGTIHPAQIMLGQFNYVIASVKIGDQIYLMDATEKTCSYNMLMPRCINGQGRVISESRPGWIDLNSTQRYEHTTVAQVAITSEGIIKGKIEHLYGNYAALDKRMTIKSKKDQDEYVRTIEDHYKGMQIQNYCMNDLDSLHKSFSENWEADIQDVVLSAGNLLTFTPLIYARWENNPFRLEERSFPVDFTYPRIYKDIITYDLPEGYTVDEKPADLLLALPDGKTRFTYRIAANGKSLQVISTLNISKSIYGTEEYKLLKEFFGQMVQKQAEKIVLKKTT